MKTPASDPIAEEAWEVWHQDTFDREAPPAMEASGYGLVGGLVELWARYLFETVRPEGGEGFSRFHLRWESGVVELPVDAPGARRLRRWVFGPQVYTVRGYVESGDVRLLQSIAEAHARLLAAGRSGEEILMAADAEELPGFKQRLAKWVRAAG